MVMVIVMVMVHFLQGMMMMIVQRMVRMMTTSCVMLATTRSVPARLIRASFLTYLKTVHLVKAQQTVDRCLIAFQQDKLLLES